MPSASALGPILVLAGPTCVGKTSVAVEICRRHGGEIVGADSVQVYRGFNIGSAKPSVEELAGVTHHLVDVLDPDEHIDASRYASLADQAIAGVHARGHLPVVVGGTGLWLRALLRGLLELPPSDPTTRRQLEAQWQAAGPEAMHARLAAVDPGAAGAVHPNDRLRVVRALEVYAQTGRPIGALRAEHALGAPRYRSLMWVLDIPTAHHVERVRTRIRGMWQAGWPHEVAGLLSRFPPQSRAFSAVGYREVVEHLQTGLSEVDTLARIERSTLGYAKRQRNWFRGDTTVDTHLQPGQATQREQLAALTRHIGDSL